MDLWNAFSAAVKQQTQEIANTIQGTDWKSELTAFQEGFVEETTDLSQKAKAATEELSHKTIDLAKQLPTVVEQSKQRAAATLENLPATTKEATTSLSHLGHQLVNNTTELFEHVSTAIHHEVCAVQTATATSFKRMTSSTTTDDAHRTNNKNQFNRLDADITALQRDSSTYCDEPTDQDDYLAWKSTFNIDTAKVDINKILSENVFMSELQARLVPVVVEYDVFWTRYFYRVHKLEEKHAKVAELTSKMSKQAMEDDFAWESEEEKDDKEDKDVVVVVDEGEKKEVVEEEEEEERLDGDGDDTSVQLKEEVIEKERIDDGHGDVDEEQRTVQDNKEQHDDDTTEHAAGDTSTAIITDANMNDSSTEELKSEEKKERIDDNKKKNKDQAHVGDDEIDSFLDGDDENKAVETTTTTAAAEGDDIDEDWGDDVADWE